MMRVSALALLLVAGSAVAGPPQQVPIPDIDNPSSGPPVKVEKPAPPVKVENPGHPGPVDDPTPAEEIKEKYNAYDQKWHVEVQCPDGSWSPASDIDKGTAIGRARGNCP